MSRSFFKTVLALLPLVVMAVPGCSSLNLSEGLKWPESKDKPRIPHRIVDVWTDDILHQSGQPSTRGFGGRFMFYSRESDTPVKVDGALTVYLFDDRCEDPLREEPIHKFVFPAETLEKHYSESELGHSYSFWLPVDEVGGVERKLTVIARFEPKAGGKLMAKPSTHVLPGRAVDNRPTSPLVQRFEAKRYEKKANGEVRQVAYIESVPGDLPTEPPQQKGITTTTINLPPDFTRQIANTPSHSAFGVTIAAPAGNPTPLGAGSFNGMPPAPAATGWTTQPAQMPGAVRESMNPQPADLRPVHSQLSRFPARREALGRPVASRARTQPLHATWPSALPSTPRSGWSNESSATTTNAASQPSRWPEQEPW